MKQRLSMVARELRWRWGSALLTAVLVAMSLATVLWADAVARGAADHTRRIQRDIGMNLVVLPKNTNASRWWLHHEVQGSLPASAVDRLEQSGLAGRLLPLVRRVVQVNGVDVLLTGMGRERTGGKKAVFEQAVGEGVVLGSAVAAELGVAAGDRIPLPGGEMVVQDVLLEQGAVDDISVWMPLAEAQRRLGLEGRVTEIEALECRCDPSIQDPAAWIIARAAEAVPEAVVIRRHAPAEARRKQRALAESIAGLVGPAGAVTGLLLVGGLAWLNTRARRAECGVLRALGWTRLELVGMLSGRWFVIGLLGAVLGLLLAATLVIEMSAMWWWSLLAAPTAAMSAGLLPVLRAAAADPVKALRT